MRFRDAFLKNNGSVFTLNTLSLVHLALCEVTTDVGIMGMAKSSLYQTQVSGLSAICNICHHWRIGCVQWLSCCVSSLFVWLTMIYAYVKNTVVVLLHCIFSLVALLSCLKPAYGFTRCHWNVLPHLHTLYTKNVLRSNIQWP